MTAFFYIESAPGCIFSTQTRSADISSKINCWEFVESETKTSAVTWQHANYHSRNSVEVQCFPGFTRIKSCKCCWLIYVEYHWYITGWVLRGYDLSWQHAGWLRGPHCHKTMCCQTVRVFCIQSRRIDHKHGKIVRLSDQRVPGLEQIYMAMHGRKFTKQPVLYFVTSVVKKSILIY